MEIRANKAREGEGPSNNIIGGSNGHGCLVDMGGEKLELAKNVSEDG